MADDKKGRDKQARDDENRQRMRDVAEALERADETEPPVDDRDLDELEADLETLRYPATGVEAVAAVGDREIESDEGTYTVAELIPETEAVTFDSPAAVRVRVQRPTVAASMKRILEASDAFASAEFGRSQREAYERTLRELKAIDADDNDEGVEAITDWIVDRIHDAEQLPGSRDVRRQAATFCRANGYQIRTDEWLGV